MVAFSIHPHYIGGDMRWFKQKTTKNAAIDETALWRALAGVMDARAQKDIVTLGYVSQLQIKSAQRQVQLVLSIPYAEKHEANGLHRECTGIIKKMAPNYSAHIVISAESQPEAGTTAAKKPAQWNRTPLPHVKKIIAIASGKGGVGKSSMTVLLAHAMHKKGMRVGILDADIYGPSIPRMLGLMECPKPDIDEGLMQPLTAHHISCMSMGFIAGDNAAILRGPMVSKSLFQMLRQTAWGTEDSPLDLLLIDMPPGTGDVHLSLAQQTPIDGAIIVTTPQQIATADASKAAIMFSKIDIPILGIIENMSYMEQPDGTKITVFGEGGGAELAQKAATTLLAQIPLNPSIANHLDEGRVTDRNPITDNVIEALLANHSS